MAACSKIDGLTQAFIDSELSPAETLIYEQHLAECRGCAGKFKTQKATTALLFEVHREVGLREDLTHKIMAHLPEMRHRPRPATPTGWRVREPRRFTDGFRKLVPVLAPALLLVLGLTIALSWPPEDLGDTDVGMVTFKEGDATRSAEDGETPRRVTLASMVREGDWYETGAKGGLLVALIGPTRIKIDSDTRVRIHGDREISVVRGRVWLDVSKGAQSFRVRTPLGKVTVFGTTFGVSVADKITLVTVAEGEVRVARGNDLEVLPPGYEVEVLTSPAPLRRVKVEAENRLGWARRIVADESAEQAFLARLRPKSSVVIPALPSYIVETEKTSELVAIIFDWDARSYTLGYCSYDIFITDELGRALFTDRIDGSVFQNWTHYEINVPKDKIVAGVTRLDIRLSIDESTGTVPMKLKSVRAIFKLGQ